MDWNKPLFIWIGIAVIVFGLGIVLFQVISGAGPMTGTSVIQYDNTRGGDGESGIGSGSNPIYSYASDSSLLSGSGSGSSAGPGSGSTSGSGPGSSTSPDSGSTSGSGPASSTGPGSGSTSGSGPSSGTGSSSGSGSGTGSGSGFGSSSDLDCVWWQSPAPIILPPVTPYCTPQVGPGQLDKLILDVSPPTGPGLVIVDLYLFTSVVNSFLLDYDPSLGWLSLDPGVIVTGTPAHVEVIFNPPLLVTHACFFSLIFEDVSVGLIQFVTVVPNSAPVADADGPYSGSVGSPITFNGSASYDPDESCGDQIVSWEWEFTGDGQYDDASGEIVQWSWSSNYSGSIGLKVTDTQGASDTDEAEVNVGPAPTPPPVTEVGGEVYPINKVSVLAPWIALSAAIIAGVIIAMKRRSVRN